MKKHLLALSALACTAALAQNTSGFDGFLSAGYGSNKITVTDVTEMSDSSNTSTLRGSFAFTHATGLGLQVDNLIDNQSIGGTAKIRTNDLALHGFFRQQNFLVGLIHQTRNFKATDIGLGSGSTTLPLDRTFTGVEGQYDFGPVTVYGLTASDKLSTGFIGDQTLSGRTSVLEARYFFNDNLRTDLSYATSKFSDVGDVKNGTTTLGLEYKFNSSPLSAYAKYQNMNGTFIDTKRFVVGINLSLGKETLKARNSSGASLNPIAVDNQVLSLFGAR